MVLESQISHEPTILIPIMSSPLDQSQNPNLNTQSFSDFDKPLITLNIIVQVNEKLTSSTFPQLRAQSKTFSLVMIYLIILMVISYVPYLIVPPFSI